MRPLPRNKPLGLSLTCPPARPRLQAAAAAAGVAPSQLASDFALWEVTRLRPSATAGLAACQGCSEVFIARHGRVGGSGRGVGGWKRGSGCGGSGSGVARPGGWVGCGAVGLAGSSKLRMQWLGRCSTDPAGVAGARSSSARQPLLTAAVVAPPTLRQAFVDAVLAFCAGSQLLSPNSPEQLLAQQQQAQQQQGGSQGGSQPGSGGRRRSSLLPAAGAVCSEAAACLSEPKVWWWVGGWVGGWVGRCGRVARWQQGRGLGGNFLLVSSTHAAGSPPSV